MFNLLAITSRSGDLARRIETLSKEVADSERHGTADEWKEAQLNEAQNRQTALNDQFHEWDVSTSFVHNHDCDIFL